MAGIAWGSHRRLQHSTGLANLKAQSRSFGMEQGSQAADFVSKAASARLVYSASSENQVLNGQQEVITKVTKDHEVVDVNGFIFRRKRRTPLTDSANVPAEHLKRTKSSVAPREDVGTMGGQGAGGCVKAESALVSLPSDGASQASRLLTLCQKCVQDAVAAAVGQPGVQQLQAMLQEFLVDVEASLANGTLQAVEACPAGNLDMQEQKALLAHLRLERDVLLSRLERFEQEEMEWLQILNSTELEPSQGGRSAGPPVAPLIDLDGSAANSPARGDGSELVGSTTQPDDDNKVRVQAAEQSPAATAVLRQARLDVHRTLTFQIDGLSSMVEGVQDLVARADQISAEEFDTLRRKIFSALPGIDSPARLIREIAKPASTARPSL
ncbi:hypothetical protein CVIRNUC_008209 [Coccomyxa viridis]|uniref:Uncharacterized protein n=1 Tax=Coccomyxa viridis TaxID=1274662 RepID=A0AAV1ID67_9CHLO|nr:hypothetical protein CVIRNUC_008209 [Coccomyxa viridis]